MFGKVYRGALLAAVVAIALSQHDECVEYTPWCSCRVQMKLLIILRPRSAPCKPHRRFESTKLYLSLLLLLLAGDIELNPGPAFTDSDRQTDSTHMDNCATEVGCVSCGMPPEGLTLRSRQRKNARLKKNTVAICAEVGCESFVHTQCKIVNSVKQRSAWKCSAHRDMGPDQLQPDVNLAVTDKSNLRQSPTADESAPRGSPPADEDEDTDLHKPHPSPAADEGRHCQSSTADEGRHCQSSTAGEGRHHQSPPDDEGCHRQSPLEVSFFRVVATRAAPQSTSNYPHPPRTSYGLPVTRMSPQRKFPFSRGLIGK